VGRDVCSFDQWQPAAMQLKLIDWVVVAAYAVLSLAIGLRFARRAGRSLEQYFLSGRTAPWWLLGTSMVATTFSADTPNLVTDLVRTGGVSTNWLWWAFLITGMLTVFFYAKLWRRSAALTDINFYELRYSGAPARFLRGSRAVYLGVFFNIVIMATVTLAAIKIAGALLGPRPLHHRRACRAFDHGLRHHLGAMGRGYRPVQFVLAMIGSVAAVLRRDAAGGRRTKRARHTSQRRGQAVAPAGFLRPSASHDRASDPACRAMVEYLVPRVGAGGGGYIAQRHARGALLRRTPWPRRCGSTSPITRSAPGRGSWSRSPRSSSIRA
jgi:hypothetical protein